MAVKVNIHPLLQSYTDGNAVVEVSGKTVGECLEAVIRRFPRLRSSLMDKDGKLLHHIDIYVNSESAYPEELAKAVQDEDELHIIMMVVGG